MYIPDHSKTKNEAQILDLVKENSFVTLVSLDSEGFPYISHIPVSCVTQDNKLVSINGHFSSRNPHVQLLKKSPKITAIFHGPHTYITPNWYRSGRDVPTWNYAVVHVAGHLKFIEDEAGIAEILKELTVENETGPNPWIFELPDDLSAPGILSKAIIGFQITPEKIEGKFKLSLNRSQEDQLGITEGLQARGDDRSKSIVQLMKKNL